MGKVIFWIIVVFLILLVLRIVNTHKARARHAAKAAAPAGEPTSQAMIRCEECGVFVPRNEASLVAGRHRCADPQCANRKSAARP